MRTIWILYKKCRSWYLVRTEKRPFRWVKMRYFGWMTFAVGWMTGAVFRGRWPVPLLPKCWFHVLWLFFGHLSVGVSFFLCIFAAGFGSPDMGAKRESGASPEQSRCCEFQRVRTSPHTGSLWYQTRHGKAAKKIRNKPEDLPEPTINH